MCAWVWVGVCACVSECVSVCAHVCVRVCVHALHVCLGVGG